VRWYVYDGLGSVMAEVAPDGTLTRTQSFDVYGAVRSSAGTDTTKHTYVGSLGHLSDDATGLIYMRARYYDPVTGRFASEDPARDAGNWYAYCDGDPVNRWDRNGREWEDVPGTRWQYDIHVDNAPNTEHVVLRDERGRLVGSYYLHPQTRTWNHPPKWHIPERVRRGLRGAGIGIPACSVIAYLEQDPLGFLAIVFNIAGEHDKAADLDRMNGTL
jgi:RHS repeat-associated protein